MLRGLLIAALALIISIFGMVNASMALNYGAGTYGTCTYDTCSITLSSSSSVAANITPSGGSTLCSVQNDSVSATTAASTGYTIVVNDGNTSTNLTSGSNTIPSVSGTAASPVVLTANKWGYRIDSVGGFGAGPTTALTNASIPSQTYAAVPISSAGGDTVRTTSTVDSGTVYTSVWYGICVNASAVAGTYTDDVVYTATIN